MLLIRLGLGAKSSCFSLPRRQPLRQPQRQQYRAGGKQINRRIAKPTDDCAGSRTDHLLTSHAARAYALTSGFQRGLVLSSLFLLASAVIALRATNTRGATEQPPQRPGQSTAPIPSAAAPAELQSSGA